jgi:hypothetical protein
LKNEWQKCAIQPFLTVERMVERVPGHNRDRRTEGPQVKTMRLVAQRLGGCP